MKRMRIGNFLIVAMAIALSTFISQGRCNELRIETLAGCRIALEDEDNRLNPYDFGRNAAFLLKDYEEPWLRFTFSLTEDSGELKRPYDPLLVNDLSFGAQGIKRFSERHAAYGYFGYSRIKEREIFRALEYDQYNDPFYLTDETTGDFIYNGPTMSVDYGLRLGRGFSLGLGIDYDISNTRRATAGSSASSPGRYGTRTGLNLRSQRKATTTSFTVTRVTASSMSARMAAIRCVS